jgi:predicted membrane channel-forming protein YqfA (hemolysin III family)
MDPVRLEPSWRRPLGIALILALIAGWAVVVVSAAPLAAPRWAQALYYLVAGLVWVLPLKPLLRWMETGRWRE